MQASVIELITDSKFIRMLEGKSRNIFISNILDVNKTCSAKNVESANLAVECKSCQH